MLTMCFFTNYSFVSMLFTLSLQEWKSAFLIFIGNYTLEVKYWDYGKNKFITFFYKMGPNVHSGT